MPETADAGLRTLAVFGAGRLYDLCEDALLSKFGRIVLADADPLCTASWRALSRRVSRRATIRGEQFEFSGVLGAWRRRLRERLAEIARRYPGTAASGGKWAEALEAIRRVPEKDEAFEAAHRTAFWLQTKYQRIDAVLSLNVMSQIPVAWRHIVSRCLQEQFSKFEIEQHDDAWLESVYDGARILVEQHLRMLAALETVDTLILSDFETILFRGSAGMPETFNASLPLRWEMFEQSEESESAISAQPFSGEWRDSGAAQSGQYSFESVDSAYGCPIADPEFVRTIFPGMSLRYLRPWLWNLVPYAGERPDEGHFQRVGGMILHRIE